MLAQFRLQTNKKLRYRRQIARQLCTQSNNSKLAAAAASTNFTVGDSFSRGIVFSQYDVLSRFYTVPTRDRQMDRQTDGQNCYINIARHHADAVLTRGKNGYCFAESYPFSTLDRRHYSQCVFYAEEHCYSPNVVHKQI